MAELTNDLGNQFMDNVVACTNQEPLIRPVGTSDSTWNVMCAAISMAHQALVLYIGVATEELTNVRTIGANGIVTTDEATKFGNN